MNHHRHVLAQHTAHTIDSSKQTNQFSQLAPDLNTLVYAISLHLSR